VCGICGVYGYKGDADTAKGRVGRMTELLSHRGPDEQGYYWDAGTGLGHRRLSVIDVAGGRQPLSNEDGTIWISYNGEVYNFPELKESLLRSGHRFRTDTDTEVIVHLYEEYGVEAVGMLDGMFAFGLWDAGKERLILARDRVGVKPLYYADAPDGFFFSSELRSLKAGMGIYPGINHRSVCRYLLLQYVPEPDSIFEGVNKLSPGHYLVLGKEGRELVRYWSPTAVSGEFQGRCPEPAEILELLRGSVNRQLVSDVPLGAFLSGGLDSSGVVALMREFSDTPVKTFSIGFEGQAAFDERPYARLAAERLGTEHYETTLSPQMFAELLPKVTASMDEPIADPAAVPTFKLSALAREHVTVVMTGEGGDELFGGYLRYALESRYGGSSVIRSLARAARHLPGLDRRQSKALGALASADWNRAHVNWVAVLLEDELGSLFPECSNTYGDMAEYFLLRGGSADGNRVGAMMSCDIATWLPDDLFAKVDRMSMAVSLEARVPYLDNRLLEAVLACPGREMVRGEGGKILLKEALRGILPDDIINRKKKGFDLPLGAWFRGDLRGFVRDSVLPGSLEAGFGMDGLYIEKMISEHEKGSCDWSLPLFGLMALSMWTDSMGA